MRVLVFLNLNLRIEDIIYYIISVDSRGYADCQYSRQLRKMCSAAQQLGQGFFILYYYFSADSFCISDFQIYDDRSED